MVGRRGGKRKKWAGRRGWENGRNRQNKKISKGVKKEETSPDGAAVDLFLHGGWKEI